jgi:hypothetical protein
MQKNYKKGIALFIAVVAVSALLLIAVAISDIAYKEQILSYAGRDSKIAFYAADSGAECAMFYDLKGGGAEYDPIFQFPLSESEAMQPFYCNDVLLSPIVVDIPDGAVTTFYFNVVEPGGSGSASACTIVKVKKTLIGPDEIATEIESRGYNVACEADSDIDYPELVSGGLRNLERSFRISY